MTNRTGRLNVNLQDPKDSLETHFKDRAEPKDLAEAARKNLTIEQVEENFTKQWPVDFKEETDPVLEQTAEERNHLVSLLQARVDKTENPTGIQMSQAHFAAMFGPSSTRVDGTPRPGFEFAGFPVKIVENLKTARVMGEPEEEE